MSNWQRSSGRRILPFEAPGFIEAWDAKSRRLCLALEDELQGEFLHFRAECDPRIDASLGFFVSSFQAKAANDERLLAAGVVSSWCLTIGGPREVLASIKWDPANKALVAFGKDEALEAVERCVEEVYGT